MRCFLPGGSGALVKIDGIMNTAKYQDTSTKPSEVTSAGGFEDDEPNILSNEHGNGNACQESLLQFQLEDQGQLMGEA